MPSAGKMSGARNRNRPSWSCSCSSVNPLHRMTSLRILLLVNQFPPDLNPSGKLMHQLAVGLVKRGHQVQVITAFPHYSGFRIAEAYRGRLVMRTVEDGLRVTRVWVFASGQKQRMWHRLTN